MQRKPKNEKSETKGLKKKKKISARIKSIPKMKATIR